MSVESFDTQNYIQYGQYQPYYINGFGISNNLTTPNTLLDIAAGSCLDSTGSYQLSSNAVITINTAVNGLNGLDTGTLAINTLYPVYLVWDPVSLQPTGAMLSLSYTQPLMPFGYSAFLLIGYVAIDGSGHIYKGYWSAGNSTTRKFTYDANQNVLSGGSQTSTTPINLINFVPNVNNTPVTIFSSFSAGATNDRVFYRAGNSSSAQFTIIAPVAGATAVTTTFITVLAQPVVISSVSSPAIQYSVDDGSSTVAVYVKSYVWNV